MNAFEKRQANVESFTRHEEIREISPDSKLDDAMHTSAEGGSPPERSEPAFSLKAASLPAIIGGLAGAALAVLVVVTMTELRPPQDPRLPGLAQQVAGFQQSLFALETTVRGAEADLVRALEADTAFNTRLDEQFAGVQTAMLDISKARQQLQVETGPGSVVFGVSVVQLADAVDSGRPFESEWVNLYALTASHQPLRDELRRLMPVASTGVPTMASLQAGLRAAATAAGTPVVDPNNMYLYSLNLVQSGLGVPVGTTTEGQVIGGLVTEADRRLAERDLVGALAALANLTESAAVPFQPWLKQARRRATANAVVAELTRESRDALQGRAKAQAG